MTNTLVEKINTDADAKVAAIIAAAEAEVAEIQAESKRVVDSLQAESAETVRKQQAQLELVSTAKAKQVAKIATQRAKREAIDGLFETVVSGVLAESGSTYVARYTQLAERLLPKDIEILSVEVPAAKLVESKDILAALNVTIEPVASDRVQAGMIVTAKDGVYDLSFHRLLSDVRPALEMELINQ